MQKPSAKTLKRSVPFVFWITIVISIVWYVRLHQRSSAPVTPYITAQTTSPIELRTGRRGALIKWGIDSVEQFERARLRYPEIAEACQVGFLHPVMLTRDVWKSVAYRLIPYEEQGTEYVSGSRIFWTGLIKIPAGELVFEDSEGNLVRARCGNCTHDTPLRKFVMPAPPPDLDTPITEFTPPVIVGPPPELFGWPPFTPISPPGESPLLPPTIPAALPPIMSPPVAWGPPIIAVPLPVSGPLLPPPPYSSLAEPGTIALLSGGLLLIYILFRRSKT
jgi:hypothetical protein